MKRLLLLRHAKASWPDGVEDYDRPLAERGQMAAGLVGHYLAKIGAPDRVLVSSARRTRETYGLVSAACPIAPPQYLTELYLAKWDKMLAQIIKQAGDAQNLLVIGHNPGTAELVQRLANHETSDMAQVMRAAVKYPTAALTVFEGGTGWDSLRPGMLALVSHVTPSQLGGFDED